MRSRHIPTCAALIGAAALTVTACADPAETDPAPSPSAAAPSATETAAPSPDAPTPAEPTAATTAATTGPADAAPAPAPEGEFYVDGPDGVLLPPVDPDTPAGRVRAEMIAEGYCAPSGCTEADFETWLWDEMDIDDTMAELDQLDYSDPAPDAADAPELPEYAGSTGEDTCSGPNPVCFDPPPPASAR